jgi:hypothetical protein
VLKWLATLCSFLPLLCFAETPFAGSWMVRPELTEYSLRPLGFDISRGMYKRTSCAPTQEVPTDGSEHPVAGDPLTEFMSVRLMDRNRVEVAQKADGRLTWKGIYAVANDGRSMQLTFDDRRSTKAITGTIQFARETEGAADAHRLSGTWRAQKLLALGGAGLELTIEDTDNGLTLSASDGRSFDIKFDRQDYPLLGYLSGATVQVGRRAAQTLQINRRQRGILVDFTIAIVSDDGRTMDWGQLDMQCQWKTTWKLVKRNLP